MHDEELTCGEELAASAEVPQKLGALMKHVALNLRAHAGWVGTGTDAAHREHDAMIRVAEAYEAIASAAARAAETLQSMRALAVAPHDPKQRDQREFEAWMREKIRLQRDFAELLSAHALESERVLGAMDRGS